MTSDSPGEQLRRLTDRLRAETGASRTTVRGRAGDDPVALLAESLAPGVESMADGQQPRAIVTAPTYVVLSETKAVLVQDDCVNEGPKPPRSLTERYRVRAQMLAPVLDGGEMIGTISVHQQDTTRHWTPADVAALERAQAAVTAILSSGRERRLAARTSAVSHPRNPRHVRATRPRYPPSGMRIDRTRRLVQPL